MHPVPPKGNARHIAHPEHTDNPTLVATVSQARDVLGAGSMMPPTTHRPCGGCQHIGAAAARVVLDAARRNYVCALVEAFAAGVPAEELARDGDAFARDMAEALAERGA